VLHFSPVTVSSLLELAIWQFASSSSFNSTHSLGAFLVDEQFLIIFSVSCRLCSQAEDSLVRPKNWESTGTILHSVPTACKKRSAENNSLTDAGILGEQLISICLAAVIKTNEQSAPSVNLCGVRACRVLLQAGDTFFSSKGGEICNRITVSKPWCYAFGVFWACIRTRVLNVH